MGKTKKVILFIVEGITDKTALGAVLDAILSNEKIHFAITEGDITTKDDVNASNVIRRINEIVKFTQERYHFKASDLLEVVHLIDTDGAFIPDDAVIDNPDATHIQYTLQDIQTNDVGKIIERNQKKLSLVKILRSKTEINKKPYKMFYFSRNQEHVLHNEAKELTTSEKNALADQFDDLYGDRPEVFLEFIKSKDFAVPGDYAETWKFIEDGIHSLERWSNFHLYFE